MDKLSSNKTSSRINSMSALKQKTFLKVNNVYKGRFGKDICRGGFVFIFVLLTNTVEKLQYIFQLFGPLVAHFSTFYFQYLILLIRTGLWT